MTKILSSISAAVKASRHVAQAPLGWDPTDHLLSRFGFGATTIDRNWLAAHGPQTWWDAALTWGRRYPGYAAHASVAAVGPQLRLSPYDARQWLKNNTDSEYGWEVMDQLTRVTIGLQAFGKAQLYEVLVDFFSNHLNVPNHSGDVWVTRHAYDRDVIRRYAFGSVTDMLLAAAKHPAMLTYLSLADSTKEAINENYGRELLELHTVGLRYSESDVKNAARLLTGRTLDQYQHYLYDGDIHPTGRVKVLGFAHANSSADGGEAAGDALIRYLATHPYTAQNLARKLCMRFVSDTPSAALVSAVAAAYLKNKTQILPTVLTILRSTDFWESRGHKIRRPAENVVATVRALGLKVTNWSDALQTLHWITYDMGNVPLDWPAPNGYPDVAAAWRSANNLLDLWDFHLGFASGGWGGLATPNQTTWYDGTPASSGDAINRMTRHLTGMTFSTAHRAALQAFLDEPAATPMAQSNLRWLAGPLAGVILDGPHHALR